MAKLLLLVLFWPLGCAHRQGKRRSLEAAGRFAEAAGAMATQTSLVEKAAELPVPADAVVADIAPADKAPSAAATPALRAALRRVLNGAVLPEKSAIPAPDARALEAPAPPVDAPVVSPSSAQKMSGLTSSSIIQQGAVARAPASEDTATVSAAMAIASFCGRWVEDQSRRIIGDASVALASDPYEDNYWLDENGVLYSMLMPSRQNETLVLDRPQSVWLNGRAYTKMDTFQHGHIITTVRDPTKEMADTVLDPQMFNPAGEMELDRWVDIDDSFHHKTIEYDGQGNPHTFTVIFNRALPET